METNKLYNLADSSGVTVDFFPLPHNKSVCVNVDGRDFVALDPTVFGSQERVCLAHELGHCATAGFYGTHTPLAVRQRHEKKAWAWAIKCLVPLSELKKAQQRGYTDIVQLAEYFTVTRDFMKRAMDFYMQNQ